MTTKQLLKKMMAFRPVSEDKQAINKVVDFLNKYLKSRKVPTKIETLDGKKILYASTKKGKRSKVLFNAHLDVVPAEEETFRPREKGNWLYGRGAGDCLGNSAVLAQTLVRTLGKADIGVIFSTDEEIGGYTTDCMVRRGYSGDFIVVLDAGGYRITAAQKGVCTLKLTAAGKSCHGSRPWGGVNAIDKLIEGYSKIKKLFPPAGPDRQWMTTMSANIVSAGTVFNKVPDIAEMVLDIRYTEKTSPNALAKKVRSASGLKVSIIRKQPFVFCNQKDPALLKLQNFMSRKFRRKIEIVRMNGATDARHFVKLKKPIAMIGIPAKGAHSRGEGADIKGMKRYEEMLYEYCLEHAGIAR